mmetsp:Transcript_16033/g.20288  ORF Transcript_16033/g.20288 Transcript_16033/m.20288 type:complete len:270 (-) Transcript_16033:192-1001(-)|eukprot:CAMPEP_0170467078 /NCGR_PEP_ID=MMETSP0123-20130129/10792_1 /TAXON_ID=182087 /ORGANISM="Favella ehrenbergii, Strain Fehren 1" /LENGTH=269 /DNA_ID=CAMNT_0010733355 /DNA_START=16 /DNA_END=825 /DNA_ORIENTATION=-
MTDDIEVQRAAAAEKAKNEAYLNEDHDLVELRDGSTTVNAYTVAKVLSVVATPFLTATGICFHALKAEHYGNVFTSWFTILVTGAIATAGWMLLHMHDKARNEFPWNYVAVSAVCLVTACSLGGLASHSFLMANALAGLCVATSSVAIAAAITSATNKSRRLKQHIVFCSLIGLAAYAAIFLLLWKMLGNEKETTYRAIFVLIWLLADIPFALYFPYALVLYVLPEQEDPEDFVKASMTLWTNFPILFLRTLFHWRTNDLSDKVTGQPG